jgi:small subunit ribosomal protein S20
LANHKSAIKRNRQNVVRKDRNKTQRTHAKTAIKSVLEAVDEGNKEVAEKELKASARMISKVASKGVMHKRTASRKISNLAKKVHQLSTSA